MATVNIYLTFNGNCKEAFDFYQSAFGGEFDYVSTFADMPPQDDMPPLSEEDKNRIMHVSLPISKETVLMGSDKLGEMGPPFVAGNNFSISIDVKSKEEADQFFTQLSEGGKVVMPMSETFWGAYFGMWMDKFGISWMINFDESSNAEK